MTLTANASTTNNFAHSFLARNVTSLGPARPESTEDLEVHLLTRAQVTERVLSGQMIQSLNVAPLLKYLFACSAQ